MKKITATIIQILLLFLGSPFFIVDLFKRNKVCTYVINKIDIWFFSVNYWGIK